MAQHIVMHRQLMGDLEDREPPLRFLVHDRDSKFTDAFAAVFRSEGCAIILAPTRAPKRGFPCEALGSIREDRASGNVLEGIIHDYYRKPA